VLSAPSGQDLPGRDVQARLSVHPGRGQAPRGLPRVRRLGPVSAGDHPGRDHRPRPDDDQHITTGYGSSEAITPAGIASGRGDAWLIGLQQPIFESHNITYIRLMAEMNNANNFYCAYNADGSPRDAAHSTTQFKRAWKRVTAPTIRASSTSCSAGSARTAAPGW
jgi:hypothetical protein